MARHGGAGIRLRARAGAGRVSIFVGVIGLGRAAGLMIPTLAAHPQVRLVAQVGEFNELAQLPVERGSRVWPVPVAVHVPRDEQVSRRQAWEASGGHLAIGLGDHVIMLQHSIYSVASPEPAASILWRDASKAEEAAMRLRLTSDDIFEFGIIDEIVPEPSGGAHRDAKEAVRRVLAPIERYLGPLCGVVHAAGVLDDDQVGDDHRVLMARHAV